jgi:hypothetical protein
MNGYQAREVDQLLRITYTGEVVPVPVALDPVAQRCVQDAFNRTPFPRLHRAQTGDSLLPNAMVQHLLTRHRRIMHSQEYLLFDSLQ